MRKFLLGTIALFFTFGLCAADLRWPDDPALWTFTNGPEFPGAKGSLESRNGTLILTGDFSGGGRYVGVATKRELPPFRELSFQVKGTARKLTVRLKSRQYDFPLSGNPAEWQEVKCAAADFDGGPLALLLHAVNISGKLGVFQFRNLVLHDVDPQKWKLSARPEHLEKNFIAPGSTVPIRLKLSAAWNDLKPEQLVYSYSDYTSKITGSGRADYAGGILSVPPPQEVGYYDLIFPKLGIHSAVVVDQPVTGAADEYFAMDMAQSRGVRPLDEIGEMFQILRNNNILWIRDRLTHGILQPAEDRFDFGASSGRYEQLREAAAHAGLNLLDVIHDTPHWNQYPFKLKEDKVGGKIAGRYYSHGDNLYPPNLIATAGGVDAITRHFRPAEKAVEVWNEPSSPSFDNSFPVEFVSALTKAVSTQFGLTGNPTEIVGIVYSGPPVQNYDLYIANGLLNDVDAVSYHDYLPADTLEESVFRLREIERESGTSRFGIPYWITEAGMPWPNRELRAAPADDRYSASEIVGKAIEFRALGIQRYFAFILGYYSELHKNFGMLDANGAPMRSMAAYAHLVRVLSHKEYLGDLRIPGAVRSRVFGDGKEQVACLYLPLHSNAARKAIELPEGLDALRAEGIDGRPLVIENGRIPLENDGIVYLYLSPGNDSLIDRNTRAMSLYRAARNYRPAPRRCDPVVIQPDYDLGSVFYSGTGIQFDADGKFHARVWFNNLSDQPIVVEPALELPEGITVQDFDPASFTLAPFSRRALEFTLQATDDFRICRHSLVELGDKRNHATPLAIALYRPPSPGDAEKEHAVPFREMEDPAAWRKNSAGELTIRRDETDRSVEFRTHFPTGVDRWTYPELLLPPGFLKDAIAIGFEVKVTPADQIRQMLLMTVCSDEKEHGPYTSIKIPAPTGEWEYRSVFLPAYPPPEAIRMLRFGVNAFTQDVSIKIRNVKIFFSR